MFFDHSRNHRLLPVQPTNPLSALSQGISHRFSYEKYLWREFEVKSDLKSKQLNVDEGVFQDTRFKRQICPCCDKLRRKASLSLEENKYLNQANSFLSSSNRYFSLGMKDQRRNTLELFCFFCEVKQVVPVCYTDVLHFQNYKTTMN